MDIATIIHRLAHLTGASVIVTAAPWKGEHTTQYNVVSMVGTTAIHVSHSDLATALAQLESDVTAAMQV